MLVSWWMQFRIVGAHQHRAVVGPSTFVCVRRDVATDAGRVITWIACRNDAVLKDDCRTLNEAKNLCRRASAEERLVRA
jgi:hypothetical protein